MRMSENECRVGENKCGWVKMGAGGHKQVWMGENKCRVGKNKCGWVKMGAGG